MSGRDLVCLEGLQLDAFVGVYEKERDIKQRLVVSVKVEFDCRKAGESDDISYALDYDSLAEICKEVVEGEHIHLIESVGERICSLIYQRVDDLNGQIIVRVEKPGAVPGAHTVAVELVRTSADYAHHY